jgi:uncharacterized protein YaaN involved in tellurite resistance
MENNNTYDNIIATLDRIIAMQDRMIEKMNGMIDTMREMNDNISSKKINDDAVTSMVERWDTTGPR